MRHTRLFLLLLTAIGLSTSLSAPAAGLSSDELARVSRWLSLAEADRPGIETLNLPQSLTRDESAKATAQLWQLMQDSVPAGESPLGVLVGNTGEFKPGAQPTVGVGKLDLGEQTMPFAVLRRDNAIQQDDGANQQAHRALFICLHGGGQNAQAKGPHAWAINSREWQAQVGLALQAYPAEGVFWVPRMADDRKGRWWHQHNQQAFDRVINHALLHWDVDPNRVYLLGVSEGGYGTDILAPFMGDRFAGATAMAAGVGLGNPAENLRNIAFRTDVGEKDTMFDRQKLAVAFHHRLAELHEQDPHGYQHSINLQKGRGHGIDYRQGPAWMVQHQRNAFPLKLVWVDKSLDGLRRNQFYWFHLGDGAREGCNRFAAEVNQQENKITVTCERLLDKQGNEFPTHAVVIPTSEATLLSNMPITLLLSDELVNLDQPVKAVVNGQQQSYTPNRSCESILKSLVARPDPSAAATCRLTISGDEQNTPAE